MASSFLSKLVNPDDLRRLLRSQPQYTTNRDRAGAVLADGFTAYDTYEKFRPWLFGASLIGMAASAYALKRRHRIGVEAYSTYVTAFLGSAVVAFVTKPTSSPASLSPTASPEEKREAGFIALIDKRVVKHKTADPKFADKAITRFLGMPGVKEQWQSADPLIRATVL